MHLSRQGCSAVLGLLQPIDEKASNSTGWWPKARGVELSASRETEMSSHVPTSLLHPCHSYTRAHAHAHTHTHTYTRTCTHTHTHTHTGVGNATASLSQRNYFTESWLTTSLFSAGEVLLKEWVELTCAFSKMTLQRTCFRSIN